MKKRCTDCIYYVSVTSKCFLLNTAIEDPLNPPCITRLEAVEAEPPSAERAEQVSKAPAAMPVPEERGVRQLVLTAITSPWYNKVIISEEDYKSLGSPEYVLIRHGGSFTMARVSPGRIRAGVIYLSTAVSRNLKLRSKSKVTVEPLS